MTKPEFRKRYSKWIKKCRKEMQYTQNDLAVLTGLTAHWISHIESGRRLPDAYAFWNIQQVFGKFY